jgi:hypothetical protein
MRHRLALATLLLVLVAAGPACKSNKPLPPVSLSMQGAALQLGIAAGSFVAQSSQPVELRQESSMGFSRGEADLHAFLGRLQISESDAVAVVSGMLDGFADPNPARGSQLISDAMNLAMTRLQTSQYPELLWVFKVGHSVGHMSETVNVVTRGTPLPEHVQAYAVLTTRDGETLQADLDKAGLPPDIYNAVMAANIEIRSVSDLLTIVRTCQKLKGMVAQMQ